MKLVYEELLEAEGERIDYVLPRSESLDSKVPWKIDVRWQAKGGLAGVLLAEPRDREAQAARRGDRGPGARRIRTPGSVPAVGDAARQGRAGGEFAGAPG